MEELQTDVHCTHTQTRVRNNIKQLICQQNHPRKHRPTFDVTQPTFWRPGNRPIYHWRKLGFLTSALGHQSHSNTKRHSHHQKIGLHRSLFAAVMLSHTYVVSTKPGSSPSQRLHFKISIQQNLAPVGYDKNQICFSNLLKPYRKR